MFRMIKMKQTLSIIVILFCLIFPSLSWGNVVGKGLICFMSPIEDYGWRFFENSVSMYGWRVRNDKFVFLELEQYPNYRTHSDKIFWGNDHINYSLNRKNLKLTVQFLKPTKSEREDNCEVYPSNEFDIFIEKQRKKAQQWYDDKLKENKI